jgi:hypothetical protein
MAFGYFIQIILEYGISLRQYIERVISSVAKNNEKVLIVLDVASTHRAK